MRVIGRGDPNSRNIRGRGGVTFRNDEDKRPEGEVNQRIFRKARGELGIGAFGE